MDEFHTVSVYSDNQHTDYRMKLFNALRSGDITLTPCNLSNLIEISKVIPKTSSSNSSIVFGKLKYVKKYQLQDYNDDILIKFSFVSNKLQFDNSLQVEIKIYEKVTELVKNRACPHFITYLGAFQCTNFFNKFADMYPLLPGWTSYGDVWVNTQNETSYIKPIKAPEFYDDLLSQMNGIAKSDSYSVYNLNEANVLILEQGKGNVLYDALGYNDLKGTELAGIIFQVLFTLSVMNKHGIQHNDLHIGNIFIQDIDTSVKFRYTILQDSNQDSDSETVTYEIKSRFMVKLFDFDRGNILGEIVNTKLGDGKHKSPCHVAGVCNLKNPKFDAFTFLYGIHKYLEYHNRNTLKPFITKFLERNISKDLLYKEYKLPGRLCNLIAPKVCKGPFVPPSYDKPLGMNTPKEMLNDILFKSLFKTTSPKDSVTEEFFL